MFLLWISTYMDSDVLFENRFGICMQHFCQGTCKSLLEMGFIYPACSLTLYSIGYF